MLAGKPFSSVSGACSRKREGGVSGTDGGGNVSGEEACVPTAAHVFICQRSRFERLCIDVEHVEIVPG